jgi:amino acid adenylation domain-containing protein
MLRDRLPEYLVPAAVVPVDRLPVTANGKIDRRSLPAPPPAGPERVRPPRTATERTLCTVFAQTLGASAVGLDDSFFDLGGDSLLASRLVSRVRSALGTELSIRSIFDTPTVAGLSAGLTPAHADGSAPPDGLALSARPSVLPLSAAQLRLWSLSQLGNTAAYDVPGTWRLRGPVDRDALGAALTDVVVRHESLRTVFPAVDGQPHQQVLDPETLGPVLRLRRAADQDELTAAVERAEHTPVDLATDLPIRAFLISLGPEEHRLVIVIHHIATDGGSIAPFARDLASAYAARRAGAAPSWSPLPLQYADYALAQQRRLGDPTDPGSAAARELAHWRERLAGLPEQLALPYDRARPAEEDHRGGQVARQVGPALHRRLLDLARQADGTLFMVLHAALGLLLTRIGAGTDLPIGTPVAGRPDAALEELVGFFVNTLVLRLDTGGDPTFRELIDRARDADLTALAHQELPFDQLVQHLDPARSASHHPLFQTMLVLQGGERAPVLDLPGLTVTEQRTTFGAEKFDLTLEFAPSPEGGLALTVSYATALFDPETAETLADRLLLVLAAGAAGPGTRLHDIDVLLPGERDRLLRLGTGAARIEAPARTLHEAVAAQSRRTPTATAVIAEDTAVSYAELDSRANRLAQHLVAAGVTPGEVVCVQLSRGIELIVAILSVLKAGAAYAVVDAAFPAQRAAALIRAAGSRTVLRADGESTGPAGIDRIDVLDPAVHSGPDLDPGRPGGPETAACVMFTSGSTGEPKAVVAPHRALLGTYVDQSYVDFDSDQVWLQLSAVSWDAFALEVFGALLFGGTVVLYPDARPDLDSIAALVEARGITILQLTASLFNVLADHRPETFSALRCAMTAGEVASAPHVDRMLRLFPDLTVVNGYGPAETHGFSTVHRVAVHHDGRTDPARTAIPVGRPVAGKQAYVLDARLRPVPTGTAGELYLSGVGTALGYLRRPRATAERFVASPFGAPGERMYRTGDSVRWNREGELEFLGRVDKQIKVRGFRVEPGEIEATLQRVPGVREAAVIPRPGRADHLIAYVTGDDLDSAELRRRTAAMLPDFMVPAAFVLLAEFPLNSNGKLDLSALPPPPPPAAGRPPATARERLLCELAADVLDLAEVGVEDDLFGQGIHSISVIRLTARAHAAGIGITPRQVFRHRTLAALAEVAVPVTAADPAPPREPLVLDADELGEIQSWGVRLRDGRETKEPT